MSTKIHKRLQNKSSTKQQIRTIGVYASLYGMAMLFLIPYIWLFSTTIQTREQIYSPTPTLLPREITLEWYRYIFTNSAIIQWTINTIILATVATAIVLLIDAMIAYSFTHLEWPGRRFVLLVIIGSFMVPGIANLIPVYTIVSELGLVNTLPGVVLPLSAGPLGVFMLYQFFQDLPPEIIESAKLDGFSQPRIFAAIVLPMMRSPLTALGLFIFVWTWNSFLWPLIILQSQQSYTLPIGVVTVQQSTSSNEPGLALAAAAIAAAPLLVLFLFTQQYLVEAVKMQGTTG